MESSNAKSIIRTIAVVFLIHYGVLVVYLSFILATFNWYDFDGENILFLFELHGIASIISVPCVIYRIMKYMARCKNR